MQPSALRYDTPLLAPLPQHQGSGATGHMRHGIFGHDATLSTFAALPGSPTGVLAATQALMVSTWPQTGMSSGCPCLRTRCPREASRDDGLKAKAGTAFRTTSKTP